jgi:hypothetical protein
MPKSCSSAPLSQDLGLSTSEVQTLGTQAELSTFCVGFQGNFTFDMVVVFPSLRFLMFFSSNQFKPLSTQIVPAAATGTTVPSPWSFCHGNLINFGKLG